MEKDLYNIAVKVFLEDGKGNLLITKDRFGPPSGGYDLPGGRLLPDEFSVPLEKVIERKMKEELGDGVRYTLGTPVVFMRHERDEALADGKKEKRRIFAVGYRATYDGGEITLGKNHESHEWVSLKDLKPEQYFTGGWLEGVKEYITTFSHS
ncbi:MAG: NUDIX hydrolase [bacterium]|nr:NUDIX hydrolase [bacterium]